MVWNWIRTRVKAAVLAGFGDALAELEQGGSAADAADTSEAVLQLQVRLRPALPAPVEKPAAVLPAAAPLADEPTTAATGETPAEPTAAASSSNGRGRRKVSFTAAE